LKITASHIIPRGDTIFEAVIFNQQVIAEAALLKNSPGVDF